MAVMLRERQDHFSYSPNNPPLTSGGQEEEQQQSEEQPAVGRPQEVASRLERVQEPDEACVRPTGASGRTAEHRERTGNGNGLVKRPLLMGKPTCAKQESFWHLLGHRVWPPLERLPLSETRKNPYHCWTQARDWVGHGWGMGFLGKEQLSLQTALPLAQREEVGFSVKKGASQ